MKFSEIFKPRDRLAPYKRHAHLSDYADHELMEVLENIEIQDSRYLVMICAEVLRRKCKDGI